MLLGLWFSITRAEPASSDANLPGLVGSYYLDIHSLKNLDQTKAPPFYVRTDPQINFPSVNGDFYGSHLDTNFGIRWVGSIHIDKPGKYKFHLQSDDGSQLTINNKPVIAYNPKTDSKLEPMADRAADFTFDSAGDFPIRSGF